MAMIATMEVRQGARCAVYTTERTSFAKVMSTTWCMLSANAGDGITQLPEKLMNCEHCRRAISIAEETGVLPGG